jgi:hypothetical protein
MIDVAAAPAESQLRNGRTESMPEAQVSLKNIVFPDPVAFR